MNESLNTNNEKSLLDQGLENIYAQLEGVPEKDKKKVFKEILEDYGIDWKEEYDELWIVEEPVVETLEIKKEEEVIPTRVDEPNNEKISVPENPATKEKIIIREPNKEETAPVLEEMKEEVEPKNKKKKRSKIWKRVGKYVLVGTAGLASMIALNLRQTENKRYKNTEENHTEIPIKEKPESKKEDTVIYEEPRFKMEIYNSLPEKAKDVYTYFANYNPTPGRGYMMLDKDSAIQYVFNEKNNLVAKITAGYGKEMGDENNTSYKLNTGKTTTPAGSYIISSATTESDRKEYGEMQYSLYGISVLGEKVTLGIHQTYPKQLEARTTRLNTPEVSDNRFSDGCINISLEEFTKNIEPYFQGDGGEIMIILPDQKSRDSGTKFQIDDLIKKSLEMMVEMLNRQEKGLVERLSIVKTEQEYNELKRKISDLLFRRAKALKILEGK